MTFHYIHEKFNVPFSELAAELGSCVTCTVPSITDLSSLRLTTMMAKLLRLQHQLHPQFLYTVSGTYADNEGVRAAREIRVMHDGTWVGSINTLYEKVDALVFSSPLIAARVRRGVKRTRQYGSAVKIMREYFVPHTPVSRYSDQREQLGRLIGNLRRQQMSRRNEFGMFANQYLAPMFRNSYEFFNDLFKAHGITEQVLEKMWESVQELRLFSELDKDAVYVHQHKGTYVVCMADTLIAQYPCSEIPRKLAEKLGKLKLVDAETFIYDTGIKLNEDHFLVIGEYGDV